MWKEGGKEDIFTQQGHDDDEEKRNATRIKKKGEDGRRGDGAKFPINNGGCVARMRDMPAAPLRRTHATEQWPFDPTRACTCQGCQEGNAVTKDLMQLEATNVT